MKAFALAALIAGAFTVSLAMIEKTSPGSIRQFVGFKEQELQVSSLAAPEIVVTNLIPFTWQNLESADLKKFADNLRKVSCPEQTVAEIIFASVDRIYRPQLDALMAAPAMTEYWRKDFRGLYTDTNRSDQIRRLREEERAVAESIVGYPLAKKRPPVDVQAPAEEYPHVAPEKRKELKRIEEEFRNAWGDSFRTNWTTGLEQRSELELQYRSRLHSLLTPQELEDHDVRHSSLAEQMRIELAGFNPTADEFRRMFKLRRALSESRKSFVNPTDPEYMDRLQPLLGERYGDYKRSRDPAFRDLLMLRDRFSLNDSAIIQVYALKLSLEAQLKQVTADSQREELKRRAREKASEVLGEKVYGSYLRRGWGEWIK
jgi:hypothetical protein